LLYPHSHARRPHVLRVHHRQPLPQPLYRRNQRSRPPHPRASRSTHDGHTAKYKIHRLVYFERFAYIDNAIAREKQLKGWLRSRKIELIAGSNPTWEDLSLNFGQPIPAPTL
jgi:predicted GIY-YIG superfamily endonuclease